MMQKKSKSYEYLDIRKVELEDHKSFLMFTVETDLRAFDDRTFRIRLKPQDKDYATYFAEILRNKVRQARMPSQPPEYKSAAFIDELERLNTLHMQGGLTDEEFAAAKRKLLSLC